MCNRPRRDGVLFIVKDDPGFDTFVDQRSTALLRAAYLLTGDLGHAEDLLQNTLVRVAQRWRRIDESPEAYARKVMLNLSRDRIRWLRRRPRESPMPDEENAAAGQRLATDGGIERIAERWRIARALAQLPVRQRQAVVLRFFEDLSVAQTAHVLGCPEGTAKVYTARAISRLRELLADDVPNGSAADEPTRLAEVQNNAY